MTEWLLVRNTLEESAGRACFTCSFQAEDIVLLHVLLQMQPDIPVVWFTGLRREQSPTNARPGRWGGAKLECGIHMLAERS
jgi:3'-phosphoadenosine 5'-phosphosulfate sulfotransferase (PAPS reductase)/FAD synthetase